MKNNQCVVVFPVYTSLKALELYSLEESCRQTKSFDQVFIAPRSFRIDETFGTLSNLDIVRFDDAYFTDRESYNRLMLSLEFYEAFSAYDYILICQTDAYLFKDELGFWCDKSYDYIGAPWYRPDKLHNRKFRMFMGRYFPFMYKPKRAFSFVRDNNVGNGGLSLRKVSTFIETLKMAPESLLSQYRNLSGEYYNEDIFWSIKAPIINKKFRKPLWKEALHFAVESFPEEAYMEMKQKLPFGCHAFNLYSPDFWKQFIHM